MWFKEPDECFYETDNFADGEIKERNFNNPTMSIDCSFSDFAKVWISRVTFVCDRCLSNQVAGTRVKYEGTIL